RNGTGVQTCALPIFRPQRWFCPAATAYSGEDWITHDAVATSAINAAATRVAVTPRPPGSVIGSTSRPNHAASACTVTPTPTPTTAATRTAITTPIRRGSL